MTTTLESAAALEKLGDACASIHAAASTEEIAALAERAEREIGERNPAARAQLVLFTQLALDRVRAREDLRASRRAREALLAGISHDLRNPLNTFAMSAGLLRDDLEHGDIDPSRDLGLVARMERAIERMQRLIEDLLEASRVEARKIDLSTRAELAIDLVRDAIAAATLSAGERSARLVLESIDDGARVIVDRVRAAQIYSRVIGYFLRTAPDGATIRFAASRELATVLFTTRVSTATAALDDARGGLAILLARGLVELHGGAFSFEAGDPSTIAFTLPAAD